MVALTLYGREENPQVRAVLLTLNALNLDYKLHQPYLKIDPGAILEDNGRDVLDGRIIATYLVRKYARKPSLYPKDYHQRAAVDFILHFDSRMPNYFFKNDCNFKGKLSSFERPIALLYEAYEKLESFLLEHDYLAGDSLTIADLCVIATLTSLTAIAPISVGKTPKLKAWSQRLTKLSYYEKANVRGAVKFNERFKELKQ